MFPSANLLQHSFLEFYFSEQLLQLQVPLLQCLELLRVLSFQAAVLVATPIIRRLGHVQLFQHRRNVETLGENPVRLLNFLKDLFRRMPLLSFRHDVRSLPASQGRSQDDSHNFWTQKPGSRQLDQAFREEWTLLGGELLCPGEFR